MNAIAEARRRTDAAALAVATEARREPLAQAIRSLVAGRTGDAERTVRAVLAKAPDNVAALCVLGDIAARIGIYADAARIFGQALALAPDFLDAKVQLAHMLFQQHDPHAFDLLRQVLEIDPDNIPARDGELRMLGQIGKYDRAIDRFEVALARHPNDVELLVGYANVLKTVGRGADSAAAFRAALGHDGVCGEAWWGLANLKTAPISDAEVTLMTKARDRADLLAAASIQICFGLGKAYEDRGNYASAFDAYRDGNERQHAREDYDSTDTAADVDRSIRLFTPAFFAARAGAGADQPDPIFILGMPRAGSTLIEQILASHSQVEGTSELPHIPLLVHRMVADRWREGALDYHQALADLPPERLRMLGNDYLAAAAMHRRTDAPFFIDKLPNNWAYVGFIKSILPNARIVDARRGAMACCFANYKQYFSQGQSFSYDLSDLGYYYRDYVRMMAHMDTVLPGSVHRLCHEQLVANPERGIRDLLVGLDLPFEQSCLRFHENARPVRTASAEQVRQPINAAGVDRWRAFESWLGELAEALGDLA